MRQTRTQITEELFNRVRHYQVVKTYPMEAIRRETGLGADSIRKIRRCKTWENWNAAKKELVAKHQQSTPTELTEAIGAGETMRAFDTISLQQSFDTAITAEKAYATRADVTRLARATSTDASKLFDEVKKLRQRDAANSRSITKLGNRLSISLEDVFGATEAFAGLIEDQQRQMDNLQAFVDNFNATPKLKKHVDKAVARHGRRSQ